MRRLYLIISLFLVSTSFAANNSIANVRTNYSSTSVGTSAWVQLVASLSNASQTACIFDSSGQTMQLGVGASGSEAQALIIPPGGGCFPLSINAGSRVSLRAITGTASTGENDLNLFF